MERHRTLTALAALALLCASAASQTEQSLPAPQPSPATVPAQRPMPFPPGSAAGSASSIQFVAEASMSQQDRELAAASDSAIAERATAEDLDFKLSGWTREQLVCSALPNHLFLRYTREDGKGDTSVFSASIPRRGAGRVRVIPILRRGYSLFSPAPVNALTVAVFNHILEEEDAQKNPGWLATGLCYAALAGAHPLTIAEDQTAATNQAGARIPPAASAPMLEIPVEGGAVISFTDIAARPRPMDWTMTFDGKGKLLAATHSARPKSSGKVVVVNPKDVEGKTVAEPSADPRGTTVRPESSLKQGKVILIKPTEVQGKPVPQ
ncbi:MAG: hypothetical protein ABR907_07145 [Terracidiphilus sp.]|jgi:hypothetical protein